MSRVLLILAMCLVPSLARFWCDQLDTCGQTINGRCPRYFRACAESCLLNDGICPPSKKYLPGCSEGCLSRLDLCWEACIGPTSEDPMTTTTEAAVQGTATCPAIGSTCSAPVTFTDKTCCKLVGCKKFFCAVAGAPWICLRGC